MSLELASPDIAARDPVSLHVDSPHSAGRFRRNLALLCLLTNSAILTGLMCRADDLGPNATELGSWVVISNGLAMLGAISAKTVETYGILKGRRP